MQTIKLGVKIHIQEYQGLKEHLDDLIRNCQQHNKKAQRDLYNLFSQKMFAVCLRYAKDYSEAQDAFQDGFVQAFKKINQFKFTGSFEGWLRRIMVNRCLEAYRKNKQVFRLEDERMIAKLDSQEHEELVLDETDSVPSLNEMLEMVQSLPTRYQMVFSMYVLDDYTHKEIAEELGITEGTSKSALSRSRKILQAKLKKKIKDLNFNTDNNVFRSAL